MSLRALSRLAVFRDNRINGAAARVARSASSESAPDATEQPISSDGSLYESIVTENLEEGVGLLRMHRPKALNAFNDVMTREVVRALKNFQKDSSIGAIVVTGSDTAFAAGADVGQTLTRKYQEQRFRYRDGSWMDEVSQIRKPLIAAVHGFALGGGCELAMACDVVIAAENAQFGQPEVTLGTIPGWGGTQRLARAIGKAKAMEMVLTGRRMSSKEAESAGLVSRVMPEDRTLPEAIDVARLIASYSKPIIETAKDCVNQASEVSLSAGLKFERQAFHSTFALQDQREGMAAFVDKRTPSWSHK